MLVLRSHETSLIAAKSTLQMIANAEAAVQISD